MGSSLTRSFAKSSAADARSPRRRLVPLSFYARPTREVARELLGKVLVSRAGGMTVSGRIVETEAYRGSGEDAAAHSYRGETPRSSVMFESPGRAYVYFIYGMYEMLNFVTEPEGLPGAVLIRALEPLAGVETMRRRRPVARSLSRLCNGPGKLCRALAIPLAWNRKRLDTTELRVVDDGFVLKDVDVCESPRVGIRQGTEHYWRFFAKESPFISRAPENRLARPFDLRELDGA
jgi:DNA-3-methyladenine glycosylase